MSKSLLNIIIRQMSQGRGAQEAKEGLQDLDKSQKSTASSAGKLAGQLTVLAGVTAAAGLAAKKAFDFAEEGAGIQLLEERFDRLADSIGTTGDVLESDLLDATDGLIGRTELLKGSMDLMGLGLAQNHDEAVRLARVVSGLDMNLNQLTLTLTNQTTMRFDALNVKVAGFKERLQELEDQGYATDEAFKLAFMAQAEDQLETLGEVAGSTAGEFKEFRANWQDLMDSMKVGLSRVIGPVMEALNENIDVRERLKRALDRGVISQEEYNRIQYELYQGTVDNAEAVAWLAVQEESLANALSNAGPELDFFTGRQEAASRAAAMFTDETDGQIDAMGRLEDLMAGKLGNELDDYENKQGDLRAEAQELREEIEEYQELSWLNSKQRGELEDLESELKDVEGQIRENQTVHAEATRSILFDMVKQRMAVDGLSVEEQKALSAIAADWGLIDDTTKLAYDSFDALFEEIMTDGVITQAELEEINQWTNEITGDYPINFRVSVYGGGAVKALGGSFTDAPNTDYSKYSDKDFNQRFGGAEGADFIVPDSPQFVNDGFGPVYFDAGERVIALPKGDNGPVGGNTVVNVYLDGRLIEKTITKGMRKQGYNSRL